MENITEVEPLVLEFKKSRDVLKSRVRRCHEEQQKTLNLLRGGIKSASEKTRDAKARLLAWIEANPHLFQKPRTQTIGGVKVGYAKGKGCINTSQKTVDLIRQHLPDIANTLINTKESVNKAAIGKLPTASLRKIGCTVTKSSDR